MRKWGVLFPFGRCAKETRNVFSFLSHGGILSNLFLFLGLILIQDLVQGSIVLARPEFDNFRRVRVIWTNELGIPAPAGLAFSPMANAFYIVEAIESDDSSEIPRDVNLMNLVERVVGSARIAAAVSNPLTMAYDGKNDRLLILQFPNRELIDVKGGPDGNLDSDTLTRLDARQFGLQDPLGMTVDPASGQLFILDRDGPRIVRIKPDPENGFKEGLISEVGLKQTGLVDPRGLAIDPTNGNFYIMSAVAQKLYELTPTGQIVAIRDLSELDLSDLQGMVFAPSGDLTDDPLEVSLYIADQGPRALQAQKASQLESGRIIELSLIQPKGISQNKQ